MQNEKERQEHDGDERECEDKTAHFTSALFIEAERDIFCVKSRLNSCIHRS